MNNFQNRNIGSFEELNGYKSFNRRDKIKSLYLGGNNIKSFEGVMAYPGLEYLDLRDNNFDSLVIKGTLPPNLHSLLLHGNNIKSFFGNLPDSIKELYLSDNKIKSFECIKDLPRSIVFLDLRGNPFGSYFGLHTLNPSVRIVLDYDKEIFLKSYPFVKEEHASNLEAAIIHLNDFFDYLGVRIRELGAPFISQEEFEDKEKEINTAEDYFNGYSDEVPFDLYEDFIENNNFHRQIKNGMKSGIIAGPEEIALTQDIIDKESSVEEEYKDEDELGEDSDNENFKEFDSGDESDGNYKSYEEEITNEWNEEWD